MRLIRLGVALAAPLLVPLSAAAAKTFVGPAAWHHIVTGSPGAASTQDVWKNADGAAADVLSVLRDSTTKFDDAVAAVHANVAAGTMKLVAERDGTCDGRKSHTFELSYDPGGGKKSVLSQTIVADGDGMTRITYTRAEAEPFGDDVKAALTAYCGGS